MNLNEFLELAKQKKFVQYMQELDSKDVSELDDFDIFFLENINKSVGNAMRTFLLDFMNNLEIVAHTEDINIVSEYIANTLEHLKNNEHTSTILDYCVLLSQFVDVSKLSELSLFDAIVIIYKIENRDV